MSFTSEQIFTGVQQDLVKIFRVEASTVTPTTKLISDLGADEIDYLDIIFHLDRRFEIRLDALSFGQIDDPEYFQGDSITSEGIRRVATPLSL